MDRRAAAEGGTPEGRYLLRELIARGGMGEVFRAVAIGAGGFEKPVVVKRILPQLGGCETLSEMFAEEARLMSRLVHPNIVQVIDFGRGQDDDYFLVMELVDGLDLDGFSKAYWDNGKPLPLPLALFIAAQMLRGLGHAHHKAYGDGRSLVHRDVSPANVLLSTVGEVKLADFGVALVAHPEQTDEPATLAGKLGYMAPEQHRGDAVDARADIFSVGVVLFQMLTGKLPFVGRSGLARQLAASRGEMRSLTELRPEVGRELETALRRALAADPEQRFDSARAMAKALAAAADAGGVRMATSDDLAEQVERIAADGDEAAVPVVALSDDLPTGSVRELTRVGDAGAFTMKVTNITTATGLSAERPSQPQPSARDPVPAPETPALAPASKLPVAPRRSPLLGGAVALLAVGAIVAVVWQRLGNEAERAVTSTPPPPPPTAGEARSAAPPAPSSAPTARPSVVPSSAPTKSARPRVATPPATVSHRPAPPASSPPKCVGTVLLAAKGSWWVSGGPTRVQAPGSYRWPCGSYGLVGKSRMDERVLHRSVVVREGATATLRFE